MEDSQHDKEKNTSVTKAYTNPGLSREALRAKRLEEQRTEVFEYILNISKDAASTIEDIMLNSEDDGHRLKAAQDILNRSGMKQAHEITVNHNNNKPPSEIIMDKINALAAGNEEPKEDDIVDAELIEENE